jgi:hypothetical protein
MYKFLILITAFLSTLARADINSTNGDRYLSPSLTSPIGRVFSTRGIVTSNSAASFTGTVVCAADETWFIPTFNHGSQNVTINGVLITYAAVGTGTVSGTGTGVGL